LSALGVSEKWTEYKGDVFQYFFLLSLYSAIVNTS
jgi:hypothetical protein